MDLWVLKEHLEDAVSTVSRAVSSRPINPVLGNVLLVAEDDHLRLAATDLELSIVCKIPAQEIKAPGATTVPAKLFAEIVRLLPGEPVHLAFDTARAVLKLESADSATEFRSIPPEEFPPIQVPNMDDGVHIPADVLTEALEQVVFAAAADEARPVLTGVSMRTNDNNLVLAATDGYRLSVRTIEFNQSLPADWDWIVPARALKELERSVRKSEAPVLLKALPERKQMIFRAGHVDILTQLIEGEYPNYQQIIPHEFSTTLMTARDAFIQACKQVEILHRGIMAAPVRLTMTPSEDQAPGVLTVAGESEEYGRTEKRLPAVITGPPMVIGFNVRFLREALESIPTDEVMLGLISPSTAAMVRPVGREDYLHIIMPMHLA